MNRYDCGSSNCDLGLNFLGCSCSLIAKHSAKNKAGVQDAGYRAASLEAGGLKLSISTVPTLSENI